MRAPESVFAFAERGCIIASMGLDGVELVMRVEERFGIEIDDSEAAPARTPGMLVDLIFSKLKVSPRNYCASQRAFYLLRRACGDLFAASRSEIRPGTPLRLFFTGADHTEAWQRLRGEVGARRWPQLGRERRVEVALSATSIAVFLGLLLGWYHLLPPAEWIGIGLAGSAVGTIICYRFLERRTQHLRKVVPPSLRELRDLVPSAMTSESILWTRLEVETLVRELVVDQLGLREGEYREDADFVKDLGLD